MFPPGTEFLVCKRVEDRRSGVLHVYLREICLGWSKNVVLWCDDKVVNGDGFANIRHWTRLKEHEDLDEELWTLSHVLKSSSVLTRQYLKSQFFEISLAICHNLRFVQNAKRTNENLTTYLGGQNGRQ